MGPRGEGVVYHRRLSSDKDLSFALCRLVGVLTILIVMIPANVLPPGAVSLVTTRPTCRMDWHALRACVLRLSLSQFPFARF